MLSIESHISSQFLDRLHNTETLVLLSKCELLNYTEKMKGSSTMY